MLKLPLTCEVDVAIDGCLFARGVSRDTIEMIIIYERNNRSVLSSKLALRHPHLCKNVSEPAFCSRWIRFIPAKRNNLWQSFKNAIKKISLLQTTKLLSSLNPTLVLSLAQ
jgi:hypothetical protein